MSEKAKKSSGHWADHAAMVLSQKNQNKEKYVCAAGISPSGMVHIGNFREVITVDLVVRALKDQGKQTRFIYSWDDFDAFRKVPKNLPNQEMLEKNLRKPLADVPDPYEASKSYADHFEKQFEGELAQLGIHPEFIYQNEAYRSGKYKEGIKTALKHNAEIVEILNLARTSPLPENWTSLSVFCEDCGRDTTKVISTDPPRYTCKCSPEQERDISLDAPTNAKLLWRVDWPMRWSHEGVDFEPGGKDHSSTGGSFDTGKVIVKKVWERNAPYYVQYDFVLAKGLGAKFSSSSGNLLTVGEALKIYEPQILRWIFASRKPNMDFSISFDLDVLKAYDDFDRTERIAFGTEEADEKKSQYEKRVYELSRIPARPSGEYGEPPAQFPFRHLCNVLQIHEGDIAKARTHYQKFMNSAEDESRFNDRAERAWYWVQNHAPEEFRFSLRNADNPPEKTKFPDAIRKVFELLEQRVELDVNEDDLAHEIFTVMKAHELNAKEFFAEFYQILIGKPQGPKLAPFLKSMGLKRAKDLIQKAL